MYIAEACSQIEYDIALTDSIGYALNKMNDLHSSQLVVLHQDAFLGVVTEEQLLNAEDEEQKLDQLQAQFKFLYLYADQHVYDALQYMTAHQLSLLPIMDKDNKYLGAATANDLMPLLNTVLGNEEPGAIIVLELGKLDISFTHIAHLVESENMRIRSTAIREIPNSTKVEMTLRLDKQNIANLVATLWRYDYTVKATFNDGSPDSDIKERYDILMNYLNL